MYWPHSAIKQTSKQFSPFTNTEQAYNAKWTAALSAPCTPAFRPATGANGARKVRPAAGRPKSGTDLTPAEVSGPSATATGADSRAAQPPASPKTCYLPAVLGPDQGQAQQRQAQQHRASQSFHLLSPRLRRALPVAMTQHRASDNETAADLASRHWLSIRDDMA